MKIQAYVPDWPGVKQHGRATADILSRFCPTVIIDDPALYVTNRYGALQWERGRNLFEESGADIMLWVMADVWPPINIDLMFLEMHRLLIGRVGVYAPQVHWSCWQFPFELLIEVEPQIYEVPCADMMCWAIRKDVLESTPHCDPVNWHGTGIDFSVIAAARLLGLKAIKDYRFVAGHPLQTDCSDYPDSWADMQRWIDSLEPSFQTVMRAVIQESTDKVFRDDTKTKQYKITKDQLNEFRVAHENRSIRE